MADPNVVAHGSDRCADCGHARFEHGTYQPLVMSCLQCSCPAFDEGVARMETIEARGNYGFPWRAEAGTEADTGVWIVLDRYGALVLRTKARGIAAIVVELANAIVSQTRVQAAERAVIEAALASAVLVEARIRNMGPTPSAKLGAEGVAVLEACARLRDLREQARAEECGREQMMIVEESAYGAAPRASATPQIRCHLPLGHEGEHEGELGTWRWPS